MTGLPHPRFKYADLRDAATFAEESAADFLVDDGDRESVAFCKRLNDDSNAADIALIEFVVANYEDLKEAFK